MAIEITSKQTLKSTLLNILFYLSLALLLVSVSAFFVLDYYQNKASQTLQDLETTLKIGKTSEQVALEKETLEYQKKINDFSSLIIFHKNVSNFFQVLEKITHPKVEFTQLDLNPEELQAVLSGKTDSFQSLGQQVLILKEENFIEDFSLSELSIGGDGKVEFIFNLFFNSNIFK